MMDERERLAKLAVMERELEGARERRATRPAPRRGGPGRVGYIALALCGVAILALCLVAGALLAERAVNERIARAFPTPEPTPDIAPLGPGYLVGPPTVDVATIRRVLKSYQSPALDDAQALYDLGVARGIDPAYCLAFFIMESAAGTQGVARTTNSVGNIRARTGEPNYDGYRLYASWNEGIADWYRLIDELYVREWGLTTLDAIVPIYAPSHDENDPAAYIRTVKRLVARWRGL